jgi:hypothetical protein
MNPIRSVRRAAVAFVALAAVPLLPAQGSTQFVANLNAASVVPTPCGPSTASGTAVVYLHSPSNALVYQLFASGLTGVTGAGLRHAPTGFTGPQIFALSGAGPWCGKLVLTATQLTWLRSGEFYVEVRTAGCPGGAIRGQLLAHDPAAFAVDLAPVPASSARGHGSFEILPDDRIRYLVQAQGLSGPGTLQLSRPGFTITLAGGPSTWGGILAASAAALTDLRAGLCTVKVTTSAFPLGEISGSIKPGRRPIPFGSAGAGSLGRLAEIGSDTLPVLGDAIGWQVYGAAPAVPAWVLIGAGNRPFDLTPLGMPGNVLQVDLAQWHVVMRFFTDANGCAGCRLPMPGDRSLLGRHLYAQWLILDPGSPGGVVVSNAMDATIQ